MQLSINPDLCTRCGECVRDCPWNILVLPEQDTSTGTDTKGPVPHSDPERERLCINCGHCTAVCKPGALSLNGSSPADCRPLRGNLPSVEALETLIKGRRSVRRFKPEPLEPELLTRALNITNHAPTGKNNLQTLFTVTDGPETMHKLREAAMKELKKAVESESLPRGMEFYQSVYGAWLKGRDVVFRDAPHLLMVSAPKDGPCPKEDCLIAMTTFDLLAPTMGIGTLWDGFAGWLLDLIAPEAGALLKIPEDHVIGYTMLFGRPAVRYHRTVERPAARVNMVRL